jgi:hypothetical protein
MNACLKNLYAKILKMNKRFLGLFFANLAKYLEVFARNAANLFQAKLAEIKKDKDR